MPTSLGVKVNVGVGTTKASFQKELQTLVDNTPIKLNIQLNIDKRSLQQTLSASGITSFGKDIGSSISQNISYGVKSAQLSVKSLQGTLDNLKAQYVSLHTTAQNPKFGGSITAPTNISQDILGMQSAINLYNKGLISADKATALFGERSLSAKNSISLFSKELGIASKQNTALNVSLSQSKGFANLEKQITDYVSKFSNVANNTAAMAQIDGLYESMHNGQTTLAQAQNQWAMMSNSFKQAGLEAETLGSKLANLWNQHGMTAVVMLGLNSLRQGLQQVWQDVLNVDIQMTELRKVTDETNYTYTKFLDGAAERARKLGSTIDDVVRASADWARLGYSIDDASILGDASILYKNVGDGIEDISTASESLISTIRAFSLEASDATSVVDKFNEVGNHFAISSRGIGEALLRSSASLAFANNTLDQSIGLITAANSTVQNPEKVGTALNTLAMRIRGAKTELEEAGEDTDGMAESVSKLREEILALTGQKVDIQIDENTFKSTYEILKDLSEVWSELTDISQANVLELIAGKRQGNIVSAIINDFQIAEDVVNTSLNSMGSAVLENEKYLDSLSGRINVLSATFQEFALNISDSDFLKGIISGLTGILETINKIVSNSGAITILTGFLAFKGLNAAVQNWDKISSALTKFGTSLSNMVPHFNIFSKAQRQMAIDAAAEALASEQSIRQNYAEAFAKENAAKAALNEAAANKLSTKSELEEASASLIAAQNNVKQAEASIASAAASSKAATAQAGMTTAFGPVGIAIAAVTAAVTIGKIAYDAYTQAQEEARQSALDAAAAFQEQKSSIDSQIASIQELRTQLENADLSQQEQYDIRKQLLELQQQITEEHGKQVDGIDLVNGRLQDQLNILQQITKEQARQILYGADSDAIDKSIKEMEKERKFTVYYTAEGDPNDLIEIQNAIDSIGDDRLFLNENSRLIEFSGTAEDASVVLEELIIRLNEAGVSTNRFDSIVGDLGLQLDKANDTLEEYQELYQDAIEAKIINGDIELTIDGEQTKKTYNDLLTDLIEANEAYNEAIAANDEEAIKDTTKRINDAYNNIANAEIDDIGVKNYLQKAADDVQSAIQSDAFKLELELGVDAEGLQSELEHEVTQALNKLQGLTDVEILNLSLTGEGTSQQVQGIMALNDIAVEYGMTLEELTSKLVEMGYLAEDFSNTAIESLTAIELAYQQISDSDIQSQLQMLYENLGYANEQFQAGAINAETYFDMISTGINSIDWSQLEVGSEAMDAAMASFASLVQSSAEGLGNLQNQFDDGAISIEDYLNGLVAAGENQIVLNEKFLETNEAMYENADAYDSMAQSIDDQNASIQSSIDTISQYADSLIYLSEIANAGWDLSSFGDQSAAMVTAIANDLWFLAQQSDVVVQALGSNIASSYDSLYDYLISGEADFATVSNLLLNEANTGISGLLSSVGNAVQQMGNAIANFKMKLSIVPNVDFSNVSIGKVLGSILGGDTLSLPKITFDINASGSGLSQVGNAISGIGSAISSYSSNAGLNLSDFNREINKGSDALNNLGSAGKNAGSGGSNAADGLNSAKDAAKELTEVLKEQKEVLGDQEDAINDLLDMVVKMLKQEAKLQKEALKDELDARKDASDKAIDLIKKSISAQKDLRDETIDGIKDATQAQKEFTNNSIEAIEDELKAREKANEKTIQNLESEIDRREKLNKLAIEGINDEIDSYNKLIDAKRKALKDEESEHDYQRGLTEREKEISSIRSQIDVFSLDDSEYSKKKVLELKDELAKKTDELQEYQHDRSVELTDDALSQEASRFQEVQEAKISALEKEFDYYKEIREQKIADLEADFELYQEKQELAIKKLEEYQERYEKLQDERIEAIEEEYDEYERIQELRIEQNEVEFESFKFYQNQKIGEIEDYLTREGQIRQDAIALIETQSDELYARLMNWNKIWGDGLTATVVNAWTQGYAALSAYNNGQILVESTLLQIAATMSDLEARINATTTAANNLNAALAGGGGSSNSGGGGGSSNSSSSSSSGSGGYYVINGYTGEKIAGPFASEAEARKRYQSMGGSASQYHVKKYAKGSKRIPYDQIANVDDGTGQELIVHSPKHGRLVTLSTGDGVIPHNQTEKLLNLANALPANVGSTGSGVNGNILGAISPNTASVVFGDFVFNGPINQDTMPDLQRLLKQYEEKIYRNLSESMLLGKH